MTSELARLRRALESMPADDRAVFELARFEALDYCDIAKRLSITISQVEGHMGRAMRHLVDFNQAR